MAAVAARHLRGEPRDVGHPHGGVVLGDEAAEGVAELLEQLTCIRTGEGCGASALGDMGACGTRVGRGSSSSSPSRSSSGCESKM